MNASLVDQLPPPPRPLSPFTVVRAVGHQLLTSPITVCGAVFIVVGLIIMTVGAAELVRERSLLRDGIAAPATVIGTYASTRRDATGDHRVYQVEFSFHARNGHSWTALQDVSLPDWNRLRAGDPLLVLYDPSNPSHNVLPMARSDWLGTLLVGFAAVLIALGATTLYVGARDILAPLRLYRSGASVTGSVVDLEVVDSELLDDRHPTRVVYRFRDQSGAEFAGSAKTLDDAFLDVVELGSAVTVLYDRRRPARNALFAAVGLPVAAPDDTPTPRTGATHV